MSLTEGEVPAVASAYYHVVLAPSHRPMGARNTREAKTLCRALDLLAKKDTGAAADLPGQRLKALEKSMVDGDWTRAQFLELLPPEGTMLVDRDEDLMVQRENELQAKIEGKGGKQQRSSLGWWGPRFEGTWKGSKGKDRNKDKGKGKPKGGGAKGALGNGE